MFSNRSLVTVIASAAAFGATMVVPAPAAQADGPYVAMAYSPSTDDAYYANASSQDNAEQKAMQACKQEHSDCTDGGSTDRCMAIGWNSQKWASAFGDTAAQAVAAAQAKFPGGGSTKGYCASG